MKRFKYWLVYYVVIITKELLTNIITSQKEDAADKGTGLKREKLAQINIHKSRDNNFRNKEVREIYVNEAGD